MPLFDETATGRLASLVAALAVTMVINPFLRSGTDRDVYQPDLEEIVYESPTPANVTCTVLPAPTHFSLLTSVTADDHNMQSDFALLVFALSPLPVKVVSQENPHPGFDDIESYRKLNETGWEGAQHVTEAGHTRDGPSRVLWLLTPTLWVVGFTVAHLPLCHIIFVDDAHGGQDIGTGDIAGKIEPCKRPCLCIRLHRQSSRESR